MVRVYEWESRRLRQPDDFLPCCHGASSCGYRLREETLCLRCWYGFEFRQYTSIRCNQALGDEPNKICWTPDGKLGTVGSKTDWWKTCYQSGAASTYKRDI